MTRRAAFDDGRDLGGKRDEWGDTGSCPKCGHSVDGVDDVIMAHADGSTGCNNCAKDEDY